MRPLALLLALVALPLAAQPAADWHLADPDSGTPGIALDEAYALVDGRTPREIVVAIIDSGVDPEHPDLAPVMWVNADEIPGNGQDDDGNGYVDDVHGWSFLGGADGQNIERETYEITRLVRSYRQRAAAGDVEAAARLPELEAALDEAVREYSFYRVMGSGMLQQAEAADALLRERFPDTYDPADPGALAVGMDAEAGRAQQQLVGMAAQGLSLEALQTMMEQVDSALDYGYNVDFDPRGIVGDDPANMTERYYGNADVHGPDPNHGTGVAGLVAALRGNDFGIEGVAPNTAEGAPVRIMAVRAVPDGDERDKDIANAIRYAVDNGAHIINMSFGKAYSPEKSVVDEAAQYAAERGVLLVHAAGNDGKDIGTADNFPNDVTTTGDLVSTWLEVGASTADVGALAASFSNVGDEEVDLFAPGAQVKSLAPGGETQIADGTSFAAPVVAGVAALVMAYVPELSAEEVRQVLLDSVTDFSGKTTPQPGGEMAVPFETLSVTGGVINAAEALRLAMERAGN
ncbi:MAG TPA: peptidase S8 [Bacteroidetes bacterium]|nr:peptidase S8 [Bacteroidota bacterium]HIL57881.1 peptidase S8 [Rhodothermales bacterium]